MSVSVNASRPAIDQPSVLRVLKSSAPKVLMASALVAGLAFAALSLAAPRYQSTVQLAVTADAAGKGTKAIARDLQAADLLARVADELKLEQRPEFNPALGAVDMLDALLRAVGIRESSSAADGRAAALAAMRDSLDVLATTERQFAVRFTSRDPALAADVANKIAETYARSLASARHEGLDAQNATIKRNVDTLSQALQTGHAQIVRQRNEISAALGEGSIDERLAGMSADVAKAQTERSAADEQVRHARDMMKSGAAVTLADAQRLPTVHDLVRQRVRAERQIAELSAMLNPVHPRVRQLDAELGRLKKRISAEIAVQTGSLDVEAKAAAARADEAQARYDALKSRVDAMAPQRARLRQLEAAAIAKQAELKAAQAQLVASREEIEKLAASVAGTIVARAQPSGAALPTQNGQLAGLIFLATLLLGTALSVARALFAAARGGAATTRAASREGAALIAPVRAVPGAIENSISAVVDRLVRARTPEGGHRTLVASAVDGVDAGSEALAIAKGLAQSDANVVLVDWNRRGIAGATLAALPATPGINDLLTGAAGFEDVVRRIPGTAVHAIACGSALQSGGDKVDADLLNMVLDALDEAYDHIVVSGAHGETRSLFEIILGRFDAGVSVEDGARAFGAIGDADGTFLGFPVADIDVIRFRRAGDPFVATPAPLARFGLRERLAAAS